MLDYFKDLLQVIETSLESVDENVFLRLVDESVHTLDNGHKIVVSGLGKNVPICDKFVGSMNSLGMDAQFLHTNSAVHGDMGIVKNGDLVIILTKSGATAESVYLVDRLADRDIDMWLLTFTKDSILSHKLSNTLLIEMEHEGDLWNIMPNNSTTLNLIVLQGLVMQIAKKRNISLDDFKRNHPGGHIGEILQHE